MWLDINCLLSLPASHAEACCQRDGDCYDCYRSEQLRQGKLPVAVRKARPQTLALSAADSIRLGCCLRSLRVALALNQVAYAQPHGALVRRGDVLSALLAAEAHN